MPRDDQLKHNADRRALFSVMDEQAIPYWPDDPKFSDPEYVEAVRRGEPRDLAESSGLEWDPRVWERREAVRRGGDPTPPFDGRRRSAGQCRGDAHDERHPQSGRACRGRIVRQSEHQRLTASRCLAVSRG